MKSRGEGTCWCLEIVPTSQVFSLPALVTSIQKATTLQGIVWHSSKTYVTEEDTPCVLCTLSVSKEQASSLEPQLLTQVAAVEGVLSVEVCVSAPAIIPLLSLTTDEMSFPAALIIAGTVTQDQTTETMATIVLPDATKTETLLQCNLPPEPLPAMLSIYKDTGLILLPSRMPLNHINTLLTVGQARIKAASDALAAHHPNIDTGRDSFAFSEIGSRGGQRFDLLFDRSDPSSAPVFHYADYGPWVGLVDALLGPEKHCLASIVYSLPGAPHQSWHADGQHIGPDANWHGRVESPPYALCVFVPLIDLSPEVGYTQFWAGSHKFSGLIGFGPAAPLLGGAVDGVVAAGGAVIYDYRLLHRGMANQSAETLRPVLQFVYHVPSYKELKNYGCSSLFSAPE